MTEHPNLAAALVAAVSELTVIEKGRKANAGSYSYDYASIEDVVKRTRPALAEHGVIALTPVHDHGSGLACTVVFLHTSGERMDLGPFPFPHGKDAQATGSMVTYHRRYALVSALGMAAGDDDDGALAVAKQQAAQQPADGPITEANAQALVKKCEAAGIPVHAVVMRATDGRTGEPTELLRSEVKDAKQALEDLSAVAS